MEAMEGADGKIVLYDGVCNLCDAAVRFILPRDSRGNFRFASLQGKLAQEILTRRGIPSGQALESIVLIENGKPYLHSAGILRIARGLDFPWSLAAVFLIVPAPIRDAVYRWIARNRYRWFGKAEECLLPKPEWRARFLEWPVDDRSPPR
ncbi:MAG: thiol-disulfide oxidoreductase DCC family protein [Bdellovibrionales bacterium]|nr:thiol-disulfide oxidoreductase DCC family protein [Bdellovibrionales bacterium]